MLKIIFTSMSPLPLLLTKSTTLWLFTPPILMIISIIPILESSMQITSNKLLFFFTLDSLSLPLITLSIWITALMFLSSTKILKYNSSPSRFSFWIIILLLFLIYSFSTNNMLMFYIMFESTLIPITMLILGWGYQPERLQASFYLFLYTILASLPLLISILAITASNSHSFFIMKWNLIQLPSNILSLWWLMTNAAFLVKLPLFLTHLWLPKAHVEAPVAGSMILAAILLKLGGYGMTRMALSFPSHTSSIPSLIMSTALWGATITSLMCLRQTDLKALIAYSSIGHMGLLIAGVLTYTHIGMWGTTFMMIAHGLSSSALFSIANMTYETTHTRSIYISKGLAMIFPYMTLWWFLLSAANMAAPPSINLLSEILLITSIMAYSPILWIPLIMVSFLSAAYSLYLYTASQHGQTPNFLNPMNTSSNNNFSTIMFHLLPIILLLLKPELLFI